MREATPDEAARARFYDLLARLLAAPPDSASLAVLGAMEGGPTPLEQALGELGHAARGADTDAVSREYHDLFIGIGRGALVPYASHRLLGAFNERPLVRLRSDLARLGMARVEGRSEPEDHAATVLDAMAGLAGGSLGDDDDQAQERFFAAHVAPWLPGFFDDLACAGQADFYRPVGRLGVLFLAVEARIMAPVRSV